MGIGKKKVLCKTTIRNAWNWLHQPNLATEPLLLDIFFFFFLSHWGFHCSTNFSNLSHHEIFFNSAIVQLSPGSVDSCEVSHHSWIQSSKTIKFTKRCLNDKELRYKLPNIGARIYPAPSHYPFQGNYKENAWMRWLPGNLHARSCNARFAWLPVLSILFLARPKQALHLNLIKHIHLVQNYYRLGNPSRN